MGTKLWTFTMHFSPPGGNDDIQVEFSIVSSTQTQAMHEAQRVVDAYMSEGRLFGMDWQNVDRTHKDVVVADTETS